MIGAKAVGAADLFVVRTRHASAGALMAMLYYSDFTNERCRCGCPWEGYNTYHAAREWRRNYWRAAVEDRTHVHYESAWYHLKRYMEDRWMDDLGSFLHSAHCEGEDADEYHIIPNTLKDMIDRMHDDENDYIDRFECTLCMDSTDSGDRCFRNHPDPTKRIGCDTN